MVLGLCELGHSSADLALDAGDLHTAAGQRQLLCQVWGKHRDGGMGSALLGLPAVWLLCHAGC
jgi:hypothetical protein